MTGPPKSARTVSGSSSAARSAPSAARRFLLAVKFFQLTGRRNGRRILFASRLSSFMAGNLRAVNDRLVERGLDADYDLVQLFKPGITTRWSRMDAVRLARSLATADVILLDDSMAPVYSIDFGPKVRIAQLWHASGALKTVGYSRGGQGRRPQSVLPGAQELHARHRQLGTRPAVLRGGLRHPRGAGRADGYPADGPFLRRATGGRGRAAALDAYPAIAGRKVWLFAPTYRGETIKDAELRRGPAGLRRAPRPVRRADAVVIIRMHPFIQQPVVVPEAYRDRIIDGSTAAIDVNDLLFAVDLLITDYSSIVFEYSVLDRPMVFFAYDLDDYIDSRDFYVPFDTFAPGRIVDVRGVIDAIRRDEVGQRRSPRSRERHFAHLDGDSTDRVIDDLILGR